MNTIKNIKPYKVYVHINKINGKLYIGQTCQTVKRRFGTNGMYYNKSTYFYNAIQKYGWNNFKHIVLIKNLNNDEANIIENYLIGKYDTTNPLKGYNLKSGGKNDKHSDITKLKISKAHKGKFTGSENGRSKRICQYDLYTHELINTYESIQLAGKKYGNTSGISDCCNNKSYKAYGYVWCFEENKPDFNIVDGRSKRAKSVIQKTLNGSVVAMFISTLEAEKITGFDRSGISKCCNGLQNTANGFLWEYEEVI